MFSFCVKEVAFAGAAQLVETFASSGGPFDFHGSRSFLLD